MGSHLGLRKPRKVSQAGINMVDLMMWLVIAALLLAAAIQGIGYYQKGAFVYQMKSEAEVVSDKVMAAASLNGGVVNDAVLNTVVDDENAERNDDEITVGWDTVESTAATNPDAEYGIERVSSTFVYYLKIVHSGVTESDVLYFLDSTASYKAGIHLVDKDTLGDPVTAPEEGTGDGSTEDGTGEGTIPTTEPSEEPTPEPETAPEDHNSPSAVISVSANSHYTDWWDNKSVASMTSKQARFGFMVENAQSEAEAANYKVEFSGGESVGVAPVTTIRQIMISGYSHWYTDITSVASGYTPGTGKITVKVTNLTTNKVSYKTWTLTVIENDGLTISSNSSYTDWWDDKNVVAMTSKEKRFGFMVDDAQEEDYEVTFTGAANIGVESLSARYVAINENGHWYTAVTPGAEGYKTGTGTITATAVHKGTGKTYSEEFTLTVTPNEGVQPSSNSSYTAWWNDKSVASATSKEMRFGFMIDDAQDDDYTVTFTGAENIGVETLSARYIGINDNGHWYTAVTPGAEGYKVGTGTITVNVTHNGTGQTYTEDFVLTVTDNSGIVASVNSHYAEWFNNKTVATGSSDTVTFGFMIEDAQADDYTVTFSGSGATGASLSQTYSNDINDHEHWYVRATPGTGGYTAGTETITATVTHNGTGEVQTKTWTLTVE